MTTRDNAAPPEDWRPEPRRCRPETCVCETAQQMALRHEVIEPYPDLPGRGEN